MLLFLTRLLVGLLALGFVVCVHESGHLLVARWCGIGVEGFNLGFGPVIWKRQIGSTTFTLSLFPFGGFCRMRGSDDLQRAIRTHATSFDTLEDGSLFSAHPGRRVLAYLAGPSANLLLAVALFSLLACMPLSRPSTPPYIATVDRYPVLFPGQDSAASRQGLRTGDLVRSFDGAAITDYQQLEDLLQEADDFRHVFVVERNREPLTLTASPEGGRWGIVNAIEPIVGAVEPGSREEAAGLKAGDRVREADGRTVENQCDLLEALLASPGYTDLTVDRAGKIQHLAFEPDTDGSGKVRLHFSLATGWKREPLGAVHPLAAGFDRTRQAMDSMASILSGGAGRMREGLTGSGKAALAIGTIALDGMARDPVDGLASWLYLASMASLSLAVVNLLPLPVFDGGQIVIALVELVRRKRLKPRTWWRLQISGWALAILLLVTVWILDR